MLSTNLRFFHGAVVFMAALLPQLEAQTGRATITGIVTDPTGAVIPRVAVTAQTEMIQTGTAQASKSVDSSVFASLPLAFGQGRNMAAFAAKLVPGVTSAGFDMRIQGTPQMTQSLVVDGMNMMTGRLPGDFVEARKRQPPVCPTRTPDGAGWEQTRCSHSLRSIPAALRPGATRWASRTIDPAISS